MPLTGGIKIDWKTYLLIFIASFLAINVITSGYAVEQALSVINSEQGAQMGKNLQCLGGIFMLRPLRHIQFFGLDFYAPFVDTDDIVISAAGTILIISLIALLGKEVDTKWWYVFFFLFVLFIYKVIGLFLVLLSGESCLGMAIVSSDLLAPFDWIMLAVGTPIIAFTLLKLLSHRSSG